MKTPHDHLFRETFSHRENAASFLDAYVSPHLLEVIDLQTIEICKDTFIEKDLEDYFSDMLYKVDLAGNPGYIYILFEHKSYDDKYLHLQLLEYMVKIWRLFLKQGDEASSEKQRKPERYLPIVLPVLVYHGSGAWPNDRTHLSSLISGPVELFSNYIPDFSFILHDLADLTDDEIKGRVMLRVVQLLFKHIREPDIMSKLPDIMSLLRDVIKTETGVESLVAIFKYVFDTIDDVPVEEIKDIVEKALSEKEGGLIMTLAEKLRKEGIEKGLKKGLKKGEIIGKIQLFHQILGESIPAKNELSNKSIEALKEILNEVERRWMQVKS